MVSPDPRFVLKIDDFHIGKNLKKLITQGLTKKGMRNLGHMLIKIKKTAILYSLNSFKAF